MKNLSEAINSILSEWNPIDVPTAIARGEYSGYVSRITLVLDDREKLCETVVNILVEELGLGFDPTNQEHMEDVSELCTRLQQVFEEYTQ